MTEEAKILIVDDLDFMRHTIREILEPEGYGIAGEAVDGRDAVMKARRLNPDLILLDITMPRMDGLTALRYLRRDNPFCRVVMCSALGEQRMILKAIQLGALDFVVKPFTRERLLSAVAKALTKGGLNL